MRDKRGQRWQSHAVWLAALAVTVTIAHSGDWRSPLAFDDYEHIGMSVRVVRGELGLTDWVLAPHNGHWIPLWKLWHHVSWWVFGFEPFGWHLQTQLLKWGMVCLLYAIGLQTWRSSGPAMVASGFAAACVFIAWDNPVQWIAASHLLFATVGLLAALAALGWTAVTRYPMVAAATTLLAVAFSITAMGSFAFFVPSLGLQAWFVARPLAQSPERRRFLFGLVALVLVLAGALFLAERASFAYTSPWLRGRVLTVEKLSDGIHHPRTYILVLQMITNGAGAALGVGGGIGGYWAAGAIGLLLLLLRARAWMLIPLGSFALAISAAVAVARTGLRDPYLLHSGRYCFVPSLWWCFALGGLADALGRRFPRLATSPAVFTVCLALASLMAIHQRGMAELDRKRTHDEVNHFPTESRRLVELAQRLGEGPEVMRILDVPVLHPDTRFYTLGVMLNAEGISARKLQIVTPMEWEGQLLSVKQRLLVHPDRTAIGMVHGLEAADRAARLFRRAVETNTLRLPKVPLEFSKKVYWLDQAGVLLFRANHPMLREIDFVSAEHWTEEDAVAFQALLDGLPPSEADYWQKAVNEMRWMASAFSSEGTKP